MADNKIWSPGKPKPCWIIWYHDQMGPGSMRVYAHKIEAEDDISEMLRGIVSGEMENWGQQDDDENARVARELLGSVMDNLDKKKVWDALADWEEYRGEYTPDGTIYVEEATLYGA
jgi:hypothetical protein